MVGFFYALSVCQWGFCCCSYSCCYCSTNRYPIGRKTPLSRAAMPARDCQSTPWRYYLPFYTHTHTHTHTLMYDDTASACLNGKDAHKKGRKKRRPKAYEQLSLFIIAGWLDCQFWCIVQFSRFSCLVYLSWVEFLVLQQQQPVTNQIRI